VCLDEIILTNEKVYSVAKGTFFMVHATLTLHQQDIKGYATFICEIWRIFYIGFQPKGNFSSVNK
jgi:hypothetical protein